MSDGFTTPNPAGGAGQDEDGTDDEQDERPPPPGGEGDSVPGTGVLIGEDVSCENCIHTDVCRYYDAMQEYLGDGGEVPGGDGEGAGNESPIEAKRLAAICDEYTPVPDDGE